MQIYMWSQKNVNIRKYCEWLLLGHFEGGIRTPRPFIISFSTLIFSKKYSPRDLFTQTKMKCYLLRTSLCAVAMDKFVSAAWSCSLSGPRLPGKPDLIPKVTLKACCSPGNLSNLALAPVWCCQAVGSLRHPPCRWLKVTLVSSNLLVPVCDKHDHETWRAAN